MADPLTINELVELAETAEYMAALPEAEEIDRAQARNIKAVVRMKVAEEELELATEELRLANEALSDAGGLELR